MHFIKTTNLKVEYTKLIHSIKIDSLAKTKFKLIYPKKTQVIQWVLNSIVKPCNFASISIVCVDCENSKKHNLNYRNIDKPTNIISIGKVVVLDDQDYVSNTLNDAKETQNNITNVFDNIKQENSIQNTQDNIKESQHHDKDTRQNKMLFGELIICSEIVYQESIEHNKSFYERFAHLLIHGMLHLQEFDHENDQEADIMEAKEIDIMRNIGFSNPYTSSQI